MKSALFLSLFLLVSCATPRQEKKETDSGLRFAERIFTMFEKVARKQTGESSAEELVVDRSPLPKQYEMAVFFMEPSSQEAEWNWRREEKEQFISSLEKSRGTTRVFELINTQGKIGDLQELRTMAAQQGAHALLIVRGAAQVKDRMNAKAASYIALLPMFFVEGNEVRSTFVGQAVLWDVKKPIVHLGVETEGDWKMERPLAFRTPERALRKSREEALRSLEIKLTKELTRI